MKIIMTVSLSIALFCLFLLLTSCGMTSARSSQSQAQDQSQSQGQGQAQGQAMGHQSRTSDMPIIIICNQVESRSASCIKRSIPGNEMMGIVQ